MAAPTRDLLSRVRGEYIEMPGLSLTLAQAERLWALDPQTCRRLLSSLVETGFLKQRADGAYVRQGIEPAARDTRTRNARTEEDHASGHPG